MMEGWILRAHMQRFTDYRYVSHSPTIYNWLRKSSIALVWQTIMFQKVDKCERSLQSFGSQCHPKHYFVSYLLYDW